MNCPISKQKFRFLKHSNKINITGPNCITCVLYLEKQDLLAITSFNPNILFYNENLDEPVKQIETNRYGNKSLYKYKLDNKEYLLISSYKSIYLLNLENYELNTYIQNNELDWVNYSLYAPNQKYIVTANQKINFYSINGYELNLVCNYEYEKGIKTLLLIKPSLNILVAGLSSKQLIFIDINTLEIINRVFNKYSYYTNIIQINDSEILVDSWHGDMYIFSLKTHLLINHYTVANNTGITSIVPIDDENLFFFMSSQKSGIFNTKNYQVSLEINSPVEDEERYKRYEFSTSCLATRWNKIIVGYGINSITIIDIK